MTSPARVHIASSTSLRGRGSFTRPGGPWFSPRAIQGQRLAASDIDAMPSFRFEEEPAGAVAARAVGALASLLVTMLVVGVASVAALRRYVVTA